MVTTESAILDIITHFITAIELTFNSNRFKYNEELATEVRAFTYEHIDALKKLGTQKNDMIEVEDLINTLLKKFKKLKNMKSIQPLWKFYPK